MQSLTSCHICLGPTLELTRLGNGSESESSAFMPTCHQPGAYGDLYRCRDCGTVHQPSLPQGAELHDLYREMSDEAYLAEEQGRRRTARRLLDLLGSHVSRGRLLEVGCGHGLLLDEARQRGYEIEGLELSTSAIKYAREMLDLPVREMALEDRALDDERYDAVLLVDVLEHLDDPVGTLSRADELLAPGGVLLVVTPDPSSPTARLAGNRWWGYLPAHFCLIPRATLRELMCAGGLVMAEDVPFVRSFTPGYWLAGLGERGGRLGAAITRLATRLPRAALLSASLGDERVLIAQNTEVLTPERPLAGDRGREHKVHVVIPAYNAARTIALVADELPAEAMDRVLLVDDASSDETATVALQEGFEVLIHPTNRGYGANQKTCYVRAALDGADIVVMVHGDNQYDPALVAEMVRPIADGEADVVIGSRLLHDKTIAGGMPRWKWLGNRALTWVENRIFDRSFSEYHTGYRAFSSSFLRSVPFLRNSDDFVFDQQIFAQIVASQARVVELPIPTRYFLEASSVSFSKSVVYGCKTLMVLARFWIDRHRQSWLVLRRPASTLTLPTDKGIPIASASDRQPARDK